jgi:serine/threonine protein kinase
VAIKVVKEKLLDRSDIIPRHVEEAAAMFPIRNEPNIVSLVGWCNSTVVVEYVPEKLDELVFDATKPLPVDRALQLARDAARGLQQLHEASGGPFAHTDIQTRQFLIDRNGRLKLNDFNRVKYVGKCMLAGQEGTKCKTAVTVAKGKWRAPEEYEHRDFDESADIYSLSLVLWSLRAREKPFGDLEKDEVYVQVPKGKRPRLDAMADYPEAMQRLIQRCWDHDPRKRPTARELSLEIDRILKSYVAAHAR